MNAPRRELQSIALIGAGSFGTAVGAWLARNGHDVRIWDIDESVVKDIQSNRRNSRYLPDCELPDNLDGHLSLGSAMQDCAAAMLIVPSRAFAAALEGAANHFGGMDPSRPPVVVWGTKGLVPETAELPSDVAHRILDKSVVTAVLSGPSFAVEMIRGLPAGLDLASERLDDAERIANWFRNDVTMIYATDDIVGVQVGGAVKNVIAIATGIADGLELGASARCALISRGFAEMNRLNLALGGRESTLLGLSGMGDLILTCCTDLSRNRRMGLALGQGKSVAGTLDEIGQEVEGLSAAKETWRLSEKLDVFMPITERVYRILFDGLAPQQAVEELIALGPSLR